MRSYLRALVVSTISLAFLLPAVALATPTVASIQTGSTSIHSNQVASVSWTTQDSGGYSYLIPCVQGFSFTNASGGGSVACGNTVSSTASASGYIEVVPVNVTGTTRSFTVRIIPKDASGVDYVNSAADVSFTVTPISNPITDFSAAATSTTTGVPLTFSWSSAVGIGGVNMKIACDTYIRATSGSYSSGIAMPCEVPLFSSDLGASGSIAISFSNPTAYARDYTLTLLPAIAPGAYDGTHTKTVTISVVSDQIPEPTTTSFTSTKTIVPSGSSADLAWSTDQSLGVNLTFSCNEHVTASTQVGTTTTPLPCNKNAFSQDLPATGATTIYFTNSGYSPETITAQVLPIRKAGGYSAVQGKTLTLTVQTPGAPSSTGSSAVTPAATSATVSAQKVTGKFTLALKRGSSGAEVTLLQKFLAQFPDLYPEGTVLGYFGPATERAVQRFQKKYNLISSGTPSTTGYGTVGPKTRTKLNALMQ